MEQRSPTNTGFATGALVERRPEESFLKSGGNPRKTARWFADATGVLHLRQRQGRLSKLEQADFTSFSVGAEVRNKNTGWHGKIIGRGKLSKKWRVRWDHPSLRNNFFRRTTMQTQKMLKIPAKTAWFAEKSWLVEWEDGSKARFKQRQLLPVRYQNPHIPACMQG